MHSRLGSVTVAAGFPQGKQPKFPIGEIPLGQYSCKKYFKKKKKSKVKKEKLKVTKGLLLYHFQADYSY